MSLFLPSVALAATDVTAQTTVNTAEMTIKTSGGDVIDPDPGGGYTMAGMKARYGDKICLKGNVDCTGALCDGTTEEVDEEVRQCIADGGAGGGLILSSSNTIHRGVRPENYRAMLAALRKYGQN